MKILFIRPRPTPETIGLQYVMLMEPLELEVLAALTGTDDTPRIVDLVLEKRPLGYFLDQFRPDVLCVTGYITNVPEMRRYCKAAKRFLPHVATIVGGVHCEVCPSDLDDPYIDFRVVRNATTAFPQLLEHIKGRGKIPPGVLYPGEILGPDELPDFDFAFPFPDRSLTARYRKKYFFIFHDKIALLKTSFGCPYQCNFCFCRVITRDQYFERPLDEVLRELESIRETEIYIVDDDFLASRERVMAFIEGVRARKISKGFLVYGRADFIARNPDVMEAFVQIGLKSVIVGFESFSNRELDLYHKNTDSQTNAQAMRVLNKLGVTCFATIILAPEWDKADFQSCRRSMLDLNIHYVNLQPLTPLPATSVTVDDRKLVFPRTDFHKWDLAHVTIQPTKLSIPEYYRQIIVLYRQILFQPRFLLQYLRRYPPRSLWRMIRGTWLVQMQYLRKLKEARHA